MQHAEAIRAMTSEKYLLNELTPEEREEFEEHFFGCPDCALEIRTGAAFLEHSKVVLSEPARVHAAAAIPASPQRAGWLAWLRPAVAVPVMALLVIVIGYQVFQTHRTGDAIAELTAPQILPSAALVSARSDKVPVVAVHADQAFLLFVDIPSDSRFSSYVSELHDPADAVKWSLPVSAEAARNTLPLQVPPMHAAPGTYTLVVRGLTPDASSVVLARYPFELQTQK